MASIIVWATWLMLQLNLLKFTCLLSISFNPFLELITKSWFFFFFIKLSFGGIPVPGKPGTFLKKNFHGCIENLYYNGINVIDLAKRRKHQIYTVVSPNPFQPDDFNTSVWLGRAVPITHLALPQNTLTAHSWMSE